MLSKAALARLRDYAFPGNVRELENILERAATLCESAVIDLGDLQLPVAAEGRAPDELQDWLDQLERQRILDALTQTRGNKTRAARLLGITFRALRYRLSRLGLEEK
jgi:two-component system response regulator PilR (NtrC family)